MYLVDTNIWLERLLDQERSEEVGEFLNHIATAQLLITDFTLHSIGVILDRVEQANVLLVSVDDVLLRGEIGLVTLRPESMHRLVSVMEEYELDFDDAYQYVAAEQTQATIVSFDADFDHTERQRKMPIDVLNEMRATSA